MKGGSLLWFDYETFGLDAARDRPVQFASLRTNENLDPISDPSVTYCQPPRDYIPNPESCLITGISPAYALQKGLPEADFMAGILDQFMVPGTCGVGYNSIRFDDEVTRNALYRNLYDPFAREWRNGNSRWDILNTMRCARALRPEGLNWPVDSDGRPTLRLDHLTVANGISHENAHDALADVMATLALARKLKESQPRLYEYMWNLRHKRSVAALADLGSMTPFVMVAGRFPVESCNAAIVVALAKMPTNPNALIVYDLRHDPESWVKGGKTAEDGEVSPFGLLHINRAPAISPMNSLREEDRQRLSLDLDLHQEHLANLRQLEYWQAPAYRALYDRPGFVQSEDPDLGLYAGFASESDRHRLDEYRDPTSNGFLKLPPHFDSPKFHELCFRYKARNFPDRLTVEEKDKWDQFCRVKWYEKGHGTLTVEEFGERIAQLRHSGESALGKREILNQVEAYVRSLTQDTTGARNQGE